MAMARTRSWPEDTRGPEYETQPKTPPVEDAGVPCHGPDARQLLSRRQPQVLFCIRPDHWTNPCHLPGRLAPPPPCATAAPEAPISRSPSHLQGSPARPWKAPSPQESCNRGPPLAQFWAQRCLADHLQLPGSRLAQQRAVPTAQGETSVSVQSPPGHTVGWQQPTTTERLPESWWKSGSAPAESPPPLPPTSGRCCGWNVGRQTQRGVAVCSRTTVPGEAWQARSQTEPSPPLPSGLRSVSLAGGPLCAPAAHQTDDGTAPRPERGRAPGLAPSPLPGLF